MLETECVDDNCKMLVTKIVKTTLSFDLKILLWLKINPKQTMNLWNQNGHHLNIYFLKYNVLKGVSELTQWFRLPWFRYHCRICERDLSSQLAPHLFWIDSPNLILCDGASKIRKIFARINELFFFTKKSFKMTVGLQKISNKNVKLLKRPKLPFNLNFKMDLKSVRYLAETNKTRKKFQNIKIVTKSNKGIKLVTCIGKWKWKWTFRLSLTNRLDHSERIIN